MATKKELEELIIRVDERTKILPSVISLIEKHVKDLNGTMSDTIKVLAKTDEIAKSANNKAETNSKNFIRLIIGVCFVLIAAILGFGIPNWLV